ncbi:hypothetical protein [Zwartia sp.]|uniref:hypothetical protein n=1 Tax=Zwartia sp. TaxID=2978004 RepID=UPI003BB167C9
MMANYNKDGVAYTAYRQDMAHGISGYMPENAILARLNLTKALLADAVDQENHYWIQHYLGALHHLDGVLLAVESIVDQLNYLQNNLLSPSPCPLFPKIIVKQEGHSEPMHHPPALIGISSQRLEIEVETLLLKATGTLERIAQLVNFQCQLGGVRYFKGVAELLKSHEDRSPHKSILELIEEVIPIFSRTIISDSITKDCLRNAIAHRASSPELMDKGFCVNWLEDGSLLAFDAELNNLPLVASVRELARAMPYFTLQCIKSLLELAPEKSHAKAWARESTFNQQFFEPTWLNPFLHYSFLISPENKGPLVSLLRWLPGGFQTHQQHLLPEIFEMAVSSAKPK